ncbi:BMP and activin membrane-bound inhibitor like [Pseudolycoriella hygida]|uniref:BMP and activin membrane-bound inhibitor like n=1 Tax=Pseudolycoriella hygida TaxID=35572 RepID=A0A9Q0NA73_9DIPT|nr:BMP and activin membrane-bound inhibitor like [Pseudolycoriella hygida]
MLICTRRTAYAAYDDIRCYCNLAKCVATGYMCRTARSKNGGCFSELHNNNDKSVARHGCMELLEDDGQQMQCNNSPRKHVKQSPNFDLLLLCCHDDMCNHDMGDNKKMKPNLTSVDSDDVRHASHSQYNDKLLEKQQQYPYKINAEVPLSSTDYNSDIWFKVATIAVPICGAIILFVLIALAIRILKNESIDSPKLNGSGYSGNRKPPVDYEAYGAHEQNIKVSPLLKHSIYGDGPTICHNNDLKNETLAKKNQLMSLEYSLLPQSCHDPSNKPTNTEVGSACPYRNINLSLNQTAKSRDMNDKKVYEKEVLNPASYWTGNYGA